MPDRKAKKHKTEVDTSLPITNINMFGGSDDPCFGKHYSPEAKECGRCGDNELCMIVMTQRAKLKRAKVEEKIPLKDKEEVDIEIKNAIKNQVITNGIKSFIQVAKHIQTRFKYNSLLEAKKITKEAALKIKNIKLYKNEEGKRRFKVI